MSFKKVFFVPYGQWSTTDCAPGIDTMTRVTKFLQNWSSEAMRQSAFLSCDLAWWLQIDHAHELIGERLKEKSPARIDAHFCMQTATPFVMTVPLPMITLHNIAQLSRVPGDTNLRAYINQAMLGSFSSQTPNAMLEKVLHLFLYLRSTTLPFGFVRSSVDSQIALFVTGPNAQFAGMMISVGIADRRKVIESLVIALSAKYAWISSRATEKSNVHGKMTCAFIEGRDTGYCYWKNSLEGSSDAHIGAQRNSATVSLADWRPFSSTIANLSPPLYDDIYFTCSLAFIRKRFGQTDSEKQKDSDQQKISKINCRFQTAAILRVLVGNN